MRILEAPVPVRWANQVATVELNGGAMELTPRFAVHAAPETKASRRAQRNLDRLLKVLRADGLTSGAAAVAETSPAGTNWYPALDGVNGTRYWLRGAGLRLLEDFVPSEVRLFSGLCLWGSGAMRAFTATGEVALTSGDSRNARHVTAITTLSGLSVYEKTLSTAIVGLSGAMKRAIAPSVHPILRWDLPVLHYLLALLDNDGNPMLRPELWRQWQREVGERAVLVRSLLLARSRTAGLEAAIASSLAILQAAADGHLRGLTPAGALEILANGDDAWRAVASVRTVETYQELTRLAHAVEVLSEGCPELHGVPGRLLITIEDPAEARILAEARAIAAAAGLRLAAVGLYPLPALLPSAGGSLYACRVPARREI